MAEFNLGNTTTVGLNTVPAFIVEAKTLDAANPDGSETFVYFDKAPENFAYYLQHPQVSSPINSLATWGFGQGYETKTKEQKAELEHITGMGKDSFDNIVWNHEVVKLAVGDAFMEIVRSLIRRKLINLIPISPERVKVVIKGSRIIRYEIWNGSKWVKKKVREIFHSHNKRIGDQVHGTSLIQSNKKIIDALLEANADERIIKHRDKALGIAEYQTNNEGKITFANAAIKKAVTDGDMLGVSVGTVKILPWPSKSSEDRQNWLKYLENLNYQTGGVPKIILYIKLLFPVNWLKD